MTAPIDSVLEELDGIATAGLTRRLRAVDSSQAAELVLDGRRVINFSSNNYLGLADSDVLRDAATRAMQEHGLGAASSRLIAGNLKPHRALEARISRWKGTAAALLFNSGYQANVGVIAALAGKDDVIFSDALNHASLIDGCRLSGARVFVYPHCDVSALEAGLRQHRGRRRLIVTDGFFSMDGDRAPLTEIVRLARGVDALLLVDEAHLAGIEELEAPVDLRVGTFGKALGGFGAYVAGDAPLIELLIQRARSFVFTTALPVPVVAAAHAAIDWLDSDEGRARRAKLADHAAWFQTRRKLKTASHIVPIYVRGRDPRRAMAACEALLERGIFAQAIRPPTVPTSRLRFSLMATHTRAQLDEALDALETLDDYFE